MVELIRFLFQLQLKSRPLNLNLKFVHCKSNFSQFQQKSLSLLFKMSELQGNEETSKSSTTSGSASPGGSPSACPGSGSIIDRSRCIFCKICDKTDPDSKNKIVFENDEFVVFPDIKPATKYHLLIVSKEHIRDAKSLNSNHIEFLDRMIQTGTQALEAEVRKNEDTTSTIPNGSSLGLDNGKILMGFHWPPFHTISHLHLHVIYPSDTMRFFGRLIFRPNSYWFVQPDWVKERLENMKK